MKAPRSDLEQLARVGLGLVLIALACALGSQVGLSPASAARAVGVLVLALAVAELLSVGLRFTAELRRGAAPGDAALSAISGSIRRGALPILGFAAVWLLWTPRDTLGVAAFALLEGAGVAAVSGARLWALRRRRDPVPTPDRVPAAIPGRRFRLPLLLGCASLLAATLGLAARVTLHQAPAQELACPLLPNGVVPPTGLMSADCPFRPFDRIVEIWVPGSRGPLRSLDELRTQAQRWPRFVEWTALRGSQRIVARVPLVERGVVERLGRFAAACLLALILFTSASAVAWNTASPAGAPLLVFYCLVSCGLVGAICAGSNEWLHLAAALSVAPLPPSIMHMALALPQERERRIGASVLAAPYYAFGALTMLLTWVGFRYAAEVWVLIERIVPVFALLAWSAIVLAALETLRSSTSGLERSRARTVVAGTAIVAAFSLAVGHLARWPTPVAYRIGLLAVVLLPGSIGVAIVRYSLFDLNPRLRGLLSSLAYSALSAGAFSIAAAIWAGVQAVPPLFADPGLVFSVVLVVLLALEPLREGLMGRAREFVSAAARRRRAAALRCAQQLAELRDPDGCARILAESIAEALKPRWVSVFLHSQELGMRPAYALGTGAPLRPDLAREADALAAPRGVVHLPRCEPGTVPISLEHAGVDVVIPLQGATGSSGILLAGEREAGGPYTLDELEYLGVLAAQGAVALENARLARELADAVHSTLRGNLAVVLAHELGKPLRVIEDIARSLDAQVGETARTHRDLRQIATLSGELITAVYGLVQETRLGRERRDTPAADVVARAVQTIDHLHGPNRVSVSLAPDLPAVRAGDELATVLTNLLDNALLASPPGEGVHVVATGDEHELRFEVVDDGHGMDATTAARAFDLFFTTRAGQGGSGVGLALCREIVEQLGGRIEMRSQPGKGTRIGVRLPRANRPASG